MQLPATLSRRVISLNKFSPLISRQCASDSVISLYHRCSNKVEVFEGSMGEGGKIGN